MYIEKEIFLSAKTSQMEVIHILEEKLKFPIEYLAYNVKRYNVPISMLLIYTEKDIHKELHESKRLTDVISTIKIGDAYFNFVFLLFTDETDSYSFVKNFESSKLQKIDYKYYYEQLPPIIHSLHNFLNTYLFEIADKKEIPSVD